MHGRAVGVAIVKHGSMYPTMELLLRHTIQYLGLRGKKCVSMPGVLDNEVRSLLLAGWRAPLFWSASCDSGV